MTVMGNDSTIINDLRNRIAALESLVEQLTAQNAKLTATVKAQAAQIADLKGKLAAANKNVSNSSMPPTATSSSRRTPPGARSNLATTP